MLHKDWAIETLDVHLGTSLRLSAFWAPTMCYRHCNTARVSEASLTSDSPTIWLFKNSENSQLFSNYSSSARLVFGGAAIWPLARFLRRQRSKKRSGQMAFASSSRTLKTEFYLKMILILLSLAVIQIGWLRGAWTPELANLLRQVWRGASRLHKRQSRPSVREQEEFSRRAPSNRPPKWWILVQTDQNTGR